MKKKFFFILSLLLLFPMYSAYGQVADTEKLEKDLKFQKGKIEIGNNLATFNTPDGFQFLDKKQSAVVLEKIWGNPEGSAEYVLGMIFPDKIQVSSREAWGIVISFENTGYVKDDDAEKINYDDLLKTMKEDIKNENKEREKSGYPPVELVGWATPPHYDKASHKLFWAKEIKFGNAPETTLNYNFRILGRKGVLVLNAVAGTSQLPIIEKITPQILSNIDFKNGNRYADFDKSTDKIAEYGIMALIAGGAAAAAKTGLLKGIFLALLAAKKFVIIGLIAVGGFIANIFRRKKKNDSTPEINNSIVKDDNDTQLK